ncbi:adhesin, partial [Streptomyces swartbergensis]
MTPHDPAAAAGAAAPEGPPAAADGEGAPRETRTPRVTVTGGARVGEKKTEGLLLGLAAGDAAGWPAARHRAARMPDWTRRLTRELDTFAEHNATTTLPVPIALN